jgi:hypothetical protein
VRTTAEERTLWENLTGWPKNARQRWRDLLADYKELATVLKDCGTNTDNPDTCGVCGKHFHECEEQKLCDEELDGTLVDIGFSCPGARAREILAR